MADYERYAASGEINSTVRDQAERTAAVKSAFAARDGVEFDEMDGLTVRLPDRSWFNLRPSNTEPLLRLNVEAADTAAVDRAARRGPGDRPRLIAPVRAERPEIVLRMRRSAPRPGIIVGADVVCAPPRRCVANTAPRHRPAT